MRLIGLSGQEKSNPGALLCLSLSMFLASLGTSIANIALPGIARVFDAPFNHVQWVVIAYLAALTIFTVIAGRLGDMFGRQRMLVLGLVLFSLSSALCGLAANIWMLITARALQGIGAAFLMVLTMALAREAVGVSRVGRAMGLLGTMSALGTATGPSLGGLLIGQIGWPAVFLVLVPVGLFAAVLADRLMPSVPSVGKPLRIGLSVLRKSTVIPNLVANLLVANVMMATLVVGPFYLGLTLGLREVMVGLVMSVGPVISICTGLPSGRLVDARGASRILSFGLVLLIVGAFALVVLPEMFGVAGYVTAIAILTPGYQLFQSANNTMVMAEVPADHRGAISGLLTLSRNLGLILGSSAMGAVFSFGIGTGNIGKATGGAVADGLQLTFVIAGMSLVAAFWFTHGIAAWGKKGADLSGRLTK